MKRDLQTFAAVVAMVLLAILLGSTCKAQCPGGVCPLPPVANVAAKAKAEASVVTQRITCRRTHVENVRACKPIKGRLLPVRRLVSRVRGR